MAMDKKLKMAWVKALESGRYKQTAGSLRKSNAFCCLGVLCKVYEPNQFIPPSQGGLNCIYIDRLGLTAGQEDTLIYMNDTKGKSFKEIAKWIRKNL